MRSDQQIICNLCNFTPTSARYHLLVIYAHCTRTHCTRYHFFIQSEQMKTLSPAFFCPIEENLYSKVVLTNSSEALLLIESPILSTLERNLNFLLFFIWTNCVYVSKLVADTCTCSRVQCQINNLNKMTQKKSPLTIKSKEFTYV